MGGSEKRKTNSKMETAIRRISKGVGGGEVERVKGKGRVVESRRKLMEGWNILNGDDPIMVSIRASHRNIGGWVKQWGRYC